MPLNASEHISPQCNSSKAVAEMLRDKLWPDHEVVLMPVVYTTHAFSAMREALAGRRPKGARIVVTVGEAE